MTTYEELVKIYEDAVEKEMALQCVTGCNYKFKKKLPCINPKLDNLTRELRLCKCDRSIEVYT